MTVDRLKNSVKREEKQTKKNRLRDKETADLLVR